MDGLIALRKGWLCVVIIQKFVKQKIQADPCHLDIQDDLRDHISSMVQIGSLKVKVMDVKNNDVQDDIIMS